ncbi:unnamed protein product, partial [Chrysoparadoxa australica]
STAPDQSFPRSLLLSTTATSSTVTAASAPSSTKRLRSPRGQLRTFNSFFKHKRKSSLSYLGSMDMAEAHTHPVKEGYAIYDDMPSLEVKLPRELLTGPEDRVHISTQFTDRLIKAQHGNEQCLLSFVASKDCQVYLGMDIRIG